MKWRIARRDTNLNTFRPPTWVYQEYKDAETKLKELCSRHHHQEYWIEPAAKNMQEVIPARFSPR